MSGWMDGWMCEWMDGMPCAVAQMVDEVRCVHNLSEPLFFDNDWVISVGNYSCCM